MEDVDEVDSDNHHCPVESIEECLITILQHQHCIDRQRWALLNNVAIPACARDISERSVDREQAAHLDLVLRLDKHIE